MKVSANRFPKAARLLKRADFDRVYRQGRRKFSENMSVFYLRHTCESATGVRVGLTVGRALGGAVQRNRIKRRLREAVRMHLDILQPPIDLVINPKQSVAKMEFAQLEKELQQALAAIESGSAQKKMNHA